MSPFGYTVVSILPTIFFEFVPNHCAYVLKWKESSHTIMCPPSLPLRPWTWTYTTTMIMERRNVFSCSSIEMFVFKKLCHLPLLKYQFSKHISAEPMSNELWYMMRPQWYTSTHCAHACIISKGFIGRTTSISLLVATAKKGNKCKQLNDFIISIQQVCFKRMCCRP